MDEDKNGTEVLIPEVVEISEKPVLRDSSGKLLPGTSNMNKTGRYRKPDPVKEYFKKLAGEGCEDLFNTLVEIAYGGAGGNQEFRNRFLRWKPEQRLKALELLLAYGVGRPVQRVEAEIEQKILQVNLDATPEDLKEEDIE